MKTRIEIDRRELREGMVVSYGQDDSTEWLVKQVSDDALLLTNASDERELRRLTCVFPSVFYLKRHTIRAGDTVDVSFTARVVDVCGAHLNVRRNDGNQLEFVSVDRVAAVRPAWRPEVGKPARIDTMHDVFDVVHIDGDYVWLRRTGNNIGFLTMTRNLLAP